MVRLRDSIKTHNILNLRSFLSLNSRSTPDNTPSRSLLVLSAQVAYGVPLEIVSIT